MSKVYQIIENFFKKDHPEEIRKSFARWFFSFSLENPWVNVSYILTAVGDRYALPQNIDRNRIDSYIEQSISINRDFRFRYFGLRLQGELLNLANVNYDVIQYYPMPGRSWRLSICLSY